jgi:CDP-glucose 4,6-dehydratase
MGVNFSNSFRDKRILITGHTGFKGAWLANWLLHLGAKVSGFALAPVYKENLFTLSNLENEIDHMEGDIRNAQCLSTFIDQQQPEIIFHLAAQSLVRKSYINPIETFETNILGGVNLLEAVKESDSVKVLIFVTSDKCYKNNEWVWGYRENDALGGDDPYSASKASAEIIFNSYNKSFFINKPLLSVASVRAGNVIGGGDWAEDRIIPDCIRALINNIPIHIRNPLSTRPWQHVLEPLGGYLTLAEQLLKDEKKQFTGAWNFGPSTEANRTVNELVEKVIGSWGEGRIKKENISVKDFHETNLLHVNSDKASHTLNWNHQLNFNEAVNTTVAWYKAWLNDENIKNITMQQIQKYQTKLNKRSM